MASYMYPGYVGAFRGIEIDRGQGGGAGVSQPNETKGDHELIKIIECPICLVIPDKEIYICEGGHSVCGTCKGKMERCGLCHQAMLNRRNFTLESTIDHFKKFGLLTEAKPSSSGIRLNCKYASDGCQLNVSNKSQLKKHEKLCEYGPILCQVASDQICTKKNRVELSMYLHHLINKHDIKALDQTAPGLFFKMDRSFVGLAVVTNWPPVRMHYEGATFLRFAMLQDYKIFYWIQLIGADSESKKYRAVISVHHPKKPQEVKVSWSVPVYPIRTDKLSIMEKNNAYLTTEQLLNYCCENQYVEEKRKIATHEWCCDVKLSRIV